MSLARLEVSMVLGSGLIEGCFMLDRILLILERCIIPICFSCYLRYSTTLSLN